MEEDRPERCAANTYQRCMLYHPLKLKIDEPRVLVFQHFILRECEHGFASSEQPCLFFLTTQLLVDLIPQEEGRLRVRSGYRLQDSIVRNHIVCVD